MVLGAAPENGRILPLPSPTTRGTRTQLQRHKGASFTWPWDPRSLVAARVGVSRAPGKAGSENV